MSQPHSPHPWREVRSGQVTASAIGAHRVTPALLTALEGGQGRSGQLVTDWTAMFLFAYEQDFIHSLGII